RHLVEIIQRIGIWLHITKQHGRHLATLLDYPGIAPGKITLVARGAFGAHSQPLAILAGRLLPLPFRDALAGNVDQRRQMLGVLMPCRANAHLRVVSGYRHLLRWRVGAHGVLHAAVTAVICASCLYATFTA